MTYLTITTRALAAVGLMALASCGNDQTGNQSAYGQVSGQLKQVIGGMVGGSKGKPAAAPKTPEQMAASALSANPAPLILVTMEQTKQAQVLAMVGENGGMRTYMTPNEQAVVMRSGMLTGTKGLGNDLSVAEMADSANLIRRRQAGTAQRTMRHLRGEGLEVPVPLQCEVSIAEDQGYSFAGRNWNARQVSEECSGYGLSFQNSYLVTAQGEIPLSRQWVSPQLGYAIIQTIRP